MRKLQDTQPLWHALIWIGIYIAAVNVGDAVGGLLHFPGTTSIVLLTLSVVLVVYLRRTRRLAFYGVRRVQPGTLPATAFFIPLFVTAFVSYGKGWAPGLDTETVVFAILLVAGVGFVEELIFRGFLLRALRAEGRLTWAIVVSGVTFGVGHVVNLLRGYSLTEQLVQIVLAILVGIALAYGVVLTGSILPGAVFHALFNLSGTLTTDSVWGETVVAGIIAAVMIPYIFFLRSRLAAVGPAPDPPAESAGSR
ncbi:CPBP family intramembrane glutamic endopeptidase [Microbacterium lushaniae]|uniref:CPBP family intramembrane metalloprotease n=1 Tax=Microbacterium lushaniae TaxID=2614639 RepID=A0A5J6L2N0_9MICO|nr:CPBP family intramembrane glutamic endopeptidase [Microbacterium lushaniae]QEW02774.1 CPBP family intramembrane metalloprotease [Microbacterium lushaniae]